MTNLVLAIDDDKLIHHVIEQSLSQHCKLIHAKNGEQGLRLAIKYQPDIILLDVEMPGMSGFEVCERLKTGEHTADIPVMFLSSKSDISERMRGYNAGAADYIVKPFEGSELLARIKVLDDYRRQSVALKQDMQRAQITAEIAMTDSGDMGRIMRYVGQSYHAHDLNTLSEYFLEFFTPLHLEVALAFWYHNQAVFFSQEGAIQPIEQELLETNKDGSRFVDFGRRTIINYPKVSLLIKNMPTDDPALYGRFKDLLPHILEATNAKIKDMEVSEVALNKVEEIGLAFSQLSEQLSGIGEVYGGKITELEAFVKDEAVKSALTEEHRNSLERLCEHFLFVNDEFSIIRYKLGEITQVRQELIQSLNQMAKPWGEDDVPAQTDIELF
ncbi:MULTISPECIES: response regulator [Pseudoalteromonas]|uniref:Response regulator n=1 Tax=Pseudoalteromonas obscura TaxID=3048491 RepID=A0ABT7ELM7_9GAMM|nr:MULTISPECIES: response regulator [Pseudoalteromonas]MBQ4837471.1 response regulator [Pseudoalteromonas luteoviolacea]MDK2595950.1 response regulator [Pseudoalteromonas sp. P94(2023)]